MADAFGTALKGPRAPMDTDAVRAAYKRQANSYDTWFGLISKHSRQAAVTAVNQAPGEQVLEVGVGTGLALPLYSPAKRVTGIDLSAEMLVKARARAAALGLRNIEALQEMDAQATTFADASFDIAVAMFVASVVPKPRLLLAELKRVVKPGGTILLVNHFARARGPIWWVERALAPASSLIGWHPDFKLGHIFDAADLAAARITKMPPISLFSLVELTNEPR
ncbi:SAM-dependent methyltransferase [Acidocella aquatica]|uniref:SAM-dependent methyltransferase n=1 Tax=Acidocella aquatica TaxID=1922313 RepID=A0ABQ6A5A5_9PROT|nr:class I SAM-dependent methyltransferase [Acidocella aquatica]GLR67644.1 SAM-dependent methyltransferase [Acidocella aquatica]